MVDQNQIGRLGKDIDNYWPRFGKDDVAADGYNSANDAAADLSLSGVPRTEEEHRQLFLGNYVPTKRPIKVASHAGRYFAIHRRLLSSRFEIIPGHRRYQFRLIDKRSGRKEKLKVLKNLIPNCNKTKVGSILHEATHHISPTELLTRAMNGLSDRGGGGGGGGGDDDDGNNGEDGGGGDDGNNDGDGSGGNNKKESRDRDGYGNGDKDKHGHDDGGGDKKGKSIDFMGEALLGYRFGYHAGYENGYPVGQLKCSSSPKYLPSNQQSCRDKEMKEKNWKEIKEENVAAISKTWRQYIETELGSFGRRIQTSGSSWRSRKQAKEGSFGSDFVTKLQQKNIRHHAGF